MFDSSTNSNIRVGTQLANVAHQLVSQCIGMGVAFIEADSTGFFVYKDPFSDDVRLDRRSQDSRKLSRKGSRLSREPSQIMWDQNDDKEDKDDKKRVSTKSLKNRTTLHGRLEKLLSSHDSDISYFSRKYSYTFADTIQRVSVNSNDESRRSTFEHVIFRHKTKQTEQEQLWNYAMTDSSSGTNSSDEIADLEKDEIDLLRNMVYDLPTIDNFDLTRTINTIREFVTLWKVSSTTRFAVSKNVSMTSTTLGRSYRVTVTFSQPTQMCPNPLAVANVYFNINYSYVMPNDYPVMITYEFETYKHKYWIMSKRNVRSITFQNHYIESILNAKLSFYVQLFEATHGPLNQKPQEYTVEEEYQMFNTQHKINCKLAVPKYNKPKLLSAVDLDADLRSFTKNQKSLMNIIRDKSYSVLVNKEEPWKFGFVNSENVDRVNSKIKRDDVVLPVEEEVEYSNIQELSLFNLNMPTKPSDIILHN